MCFIKMEVGDIVSKYHGSASKTLSVLFDIAEKNKPTILFIDEIESLLYDRSAEKSHSGSSSTIATMLEQCQNRDGVFIIAATNCPWQVYAEYLQLHCCTK